jgi:hypothetical protein
MPCNQDVRVEARVVDPGGATGCHSGAPPAILGLCPRHVLRNEPTVNQTGHG